MGWVFMFFNRKLTIYGWNPCAQIDRYLVYLPWCLDPGFRFSLPCPGHAFQELLWWACAHANFHSQRHRPPTAGSIRAAGLSLLPATRESFPGGSEVKNLPAMQETWVQSLDQEDPMEEVMATHYNILAWRIPWTEELGRLQSMVARSWICLKLLSMHALYYTASYCFNQSDILKLKWYLMEIKHCWLWTCNKKPSGVFCILLSLWPHIL